MSGLDETPEAKAEQRRQKRLKAERKRNERKRRVSDTYYNWVTTTNYSSDTSATGGTGGW